jgi:hypothetical protein
MSFISLINSDFQALGTTATYRAVATFGILDVNPYSLSNSEINQFEQFSTDVKSKKVSRKAIAKSAEDHMNYIGFEGEYLDPEQEAMSYLISDEEVNEDQVSGVIERSQQVESNFILQQAPREEEQYEDQDFGDEFQSEEEFVSTPAESVNNIKANSGKTIAELGITQEEWNSYPEDKKQNIKKCN